MINRTVVVLGLCGLASSALAQNFSLTLVPSAQTIDTSGGAATVTVTVIGDADVGDYLWNGSFGIESNNASVIDMQWEPADWSQFNNDGGHAGNGNYNQVIFGQLLVNFFPPPDSSLFGNPIGAFQVTFAEGSIGSVDMSLVEGMPYTLSTIAWPSLDEYESSDGNLTLNGTTLTLVPAPGAASLLAFAGVVGVRRRR
ncbi:MAG: hypothetical protein ACX94C_02750 [Phycisphaerales bacterium]